METYMSEFNNIVSFIMSGDTDKAASAFIDLAFSKLNEGYEIYHDTYSDAVSEAIAIANRGGYSVDEDEFHTNVTTGPRKPSVGKTNRFTIPLLKDGKETRKFLMFQIYGMDEGKFELNAWIS